MVKKQCDLIDDRDMTGEWKVVDRNKQKSFWNWRSGTVFSGKKKEAKEFMEKYCQ